jgi:hypothetical protein
MEALAVYGWINLTAGNARQERKSLPYLDQAIKLCADPKKDIAVRLLDCHQ